MCLNFIIIISFIQSIGLSNKITLLLMVKINYLENRQEFIYVFCAVV